MAAAIATYAGSLGIWLEKYEPFGWAEQLIEPARAVDHPRLAFLYVLASQCCLVGRLDAAVRYSDAGQMLLGSGDREIPYGLQCWILGVYVYIGQPERTVDLWHEQVARGRDNLTLTRASLITTLALTGRGEEARTAAPA